MAEKTKKPAEKPVENDTSFGAREFDAGIREELDPAAEARREMILAMQERARRNVGEHEVHSFPLDKEIGGFYVKSERGRPSKKSDGKEPGLIHTLDMGEPGRIRMWGFGILDFHLEENKIQEGDFIVVTRREKNEKGMWACDFGFAKAESKGGD